MSKHLSFYVQFHVRSECIGEFKERAMYVLENMSKEDTFDICYFHQDAGILIPALAKRKRIELIVMGTVSRTGIAGLFIGNNAEKVLREQVNSPSLIFPVQVGAPEHYQ